MYFHSLPAVFFSSTEAKIQDTSPGEMVFVSDKICSLSICNTFGFLDSLWFKVERDLNRVMGSAVLHFQFLVPTRATKEGSSV